MKNDLRLIMIVLKATVAAYVVACIASHGFSNSGKNRKGLVVCNRRSIEMIRQSQKQEGQFASCEDTSARLPEPFVVEAPARLHGNRTGRIGDQWKKLHRHAVWRLYLAIVNRAILDVLENGQESREAKQWLFEQRLRQLASVGRLTSELFSDSSRHLSF